MLATSLEVEEPLVVTFPHSAFPPLLWISSVCVFYHSVNRISEGGPRSGHCEVARIPRCADPLPSRFHPVGPEGPRRWSRGADSLFRAPLAVHVASGNARRYRQHCVV